MMTREISPKHNARLHSMEPPSTKNNKQGTLVMNSARGPTTGNYSERDNSQDPMKGMQLS